MADSHFVQLASVKEVVNLTQDQLLDQATDFLTDLGYRITKRNPASITAVRRGTGLFARGTFYHLIVIAQRIPKGVKVRIEGDDREGLTQYKDQWQQWTENLPKTGQNIVKEEERISSEEASSEHRTEREYKSDLESLTKTLDQYKAEAEELSNKNVLLEKTLSKAVREEDEAKKQIATLKSEITEGKRVQTKVERDSKKREEQLNTQFQELSKQKVSLEKDNKKREQQLNNRVQNLQAINDSLKESLSELKERSSVNLAEVEKRYSEHLASTLENIANSLKSSRITTLEHENKKLSESLTAHLKEIRELRTTAEAFQEIMKDLKLLRIINYKLESLESHPGGISDNSTDEGSENRVNGRIREVLLQSGSAEFIFISPFDLDEQEVQILKLVANSGEITSEQLRTQTGRRRAADDLDDLLDRLVTKGLEPILKEEDRYYFDPEFLEKLIM